MERTNEGTEIIGQELIKEYYRAKKWFIFKWMEIVKSESIGRRINIIQPDNINPINEVYLNGKLIYKKDEF